jgi:hypothetical protein
VDAVGLIGVPGHAVAFVFTSRVVDVLVLEDAHPARFSHGALGAVPPGFAVARQEYASARAGQEF